MSFKNKCKFNRQKINNEKIWVQILIEALILKLSDQCNPTRRGFKKFMKCKIILNFSIVGRHYFLFYEYIRGGIYKSPQWEENKM